MENIPKFLMCPDCKQTKFYIDLQHQGKPHVVCANLVCGWEAEWKV